jgi:segregation and condensation protein B
MEWPTLDLQPAGGTWSPRGQSADLHEGGGWAWAFQCRRPNPPARATGTPYSPGVRSEKMARLEALLFVADGALSIRKMVQAATLADTAEARRLLDELNFFYDAEGSPFRVERVATGYQLLTRPPFAPWLDKLHQRQNELKLSSPAMETLTIVAYQQPITRADIEAIRGVQCAEMLKQLMERGLVRIGGEEDSLGRPYLYDTTKKFLELFGLRSLDELPLASSLRRKSQPAPEASEATESDAPSDSIPEPSQKL